MELLRIHRQNELRTEDNRVDPVLVDGLPVKSCLLAAATALYTLGKSGQGCITLTVFVSIFEDVVLSCCADHEESGSDYLCCSLKHTGLS